ncbi:MAG: hypothetical protein IKQ46_10565 [Bacteroidales bacterium]|nr:hypothetical protein [Bacteroidales bacterium]
MNQRKLLRVVGGKDLANNFDKIAEGLSLINYHYPAPNENILSHGGVYAYPVTVGETTTKYDIDSTGTSIDTIVAGTTSGCTYKIKPIGEVKKIASATSTAIFGAATYTNCMLVLIELPTMKYTDIKVALGAGAAATLTADDVIIGEDVCYYVLPLGLYDNSGTTTASYSTYTITLNGNSLKNEFDVSGVTLEA